MFLAVGPGTPPQIPELGLKYRNLGFQTVNPALVSCSRKSPLSMCEDGCYLDINA